MRRVSPFAASLILVATPAHARFAPPLDTPMRLAVEQVRDDGTQIRRFTAERSLTFQENLDGFVASVTLDATSSEGDDTSGQMLATGLSGLLHHTLRCRLDRFGTVTGIDDIDAAWKLWLDGMSRMGGASGERAAAARGAAERLSALPPVRRAGLLCSVLTSLLPQPSDAELGVRDITLPATLPTGAPLALQGQQLSQRDPDGSITIRTRAGGAAAIGATSQAGRITLESDRSLDPRLGLVTSGRTTTATEVGKLRQTLRETTRLIIR